MHKIEMHRPSEEFARCWQAAGRQLQAQMQGASQYWLKATLTPPFLEHLSFRLGNQLFFVRIEDFDQALEVPGSRLGLEAIASGCRGHACLMPMRRVSNTWRPVNSQWGLVSLATGTEVNPAALVTDELVEMTDWEVHDLGVQCVRQHLEQAGRQLMSWTGDPRVDPSIWFVGESGPEWVVARTVRCPLLEASPPSNLLEIRRITASKSEVGYFASIAIASREDAFDPSGRVPATPLWRGHAMRVRFTGLVALRELE